MDKKYYTRAEVEEILGVSASTVKRMLNAGILRGWQEDGQSGSGKVWCIDPASVTEYMAQNDIPAVDRAEKSGRPDEKPVDRTVGDSRPDHERQSTAGRPPESEPVEKQEDKSVGDSRPAQHSVDRPVSDSRPQQKSGRPAVDRELQAENAILKRELEVLKEQLQSKVEDLAKDKDFLQDQLKGKDKIIQQQNSILMATQKNMNDLLQQHNELKYDSAKKADLIKQLAFDREKTEESAKALMKLELMIEDALMAKRLKDGIEFTKQLLKEKKK